ncbi:MULTISPECIES: GGDEF/EAL domain-containing response regulator [Pseudanabaena]|uniref:Response regulator receiver modulated diguanylate cyclase/phosphodiesterase n=2 Tax=Pseudanabaena TaxID=1152 RepID=L8N2G2_9CYAN|nr:MULTISPECIES: EAL domain-containing protein [Pseudanabaena]ELS32930.1 response regulator receiver modulated diguanylate cyclase/phosphodiesterase [Pseudanabaena biceps PCC 7429]MDG3494856.1 EAL domain-containing protein [Pseudanabaena catenata USMAC16]
MNKPSILVVDDEPDNFDVIEAHLSFSEELGQKSDNYQLHYAANGKNAIACLDAVEPDLILLDVMMPEMDGFEVCKCIKAMPQWRAVPIIMVTALTGKKDLAQCLFAGADDFISKPVNRLELSARVRSMIRIHQQYQQLAVFNTQLEAMVQQRTSQLQAMIFEDALTKLPSRTWLIDQLSQRLRSEESSLALVYIDCDQFKLVNGSFGHAVGDQLLKAIAHRLQQHLQNGYRLARMGEDEFCFLLNQIEDRSSLEAFIHNIFKSFSQPFLVANCEIFLTVCMGIALSRNKDQQPEELLQDADTAMYQAKLRGKESYQIFDRQMHLEMFNRLILENDLQRAIEQQEFILYYQPIIDLQTNKLAGFEALVRWKHPERGMVSPAEFIPSMETTGLIVPVGMLVFKQACQQLRAWHLMGWTEITISINLSVRQFACSTLLADIDRILEETAVNPANLKLEITESAIMDNAETAIALTKELRSRQIQISIDDFGTGYSSLGYLHRFPVDSLKIDRSFVSQIQSEGRNYHVVDTIIALSNQLGLAVIAEGIETKEQLEWLQKVQCQYGQGYFFNRPLPASEIEKIYLQP